MVKRSGSTKQYHRFTWLFGFLGLAGFRYFFSHDFADLFYFSFLSFFSSWFTARLAAEMPDERYEENRLKARAATMLIPALALFVIGLTLVFKIFSSELVLLIAAVGWAATFITYAVAFWYYENR